MFFDILTFNSSNKELQSLNDHCCDLQDKYGITINKQSLDERFNKGAVDFIKALLEDQLASQTTRKINHLALQHFTSIKIKDSTRFQLSENLKEYYPGSTGAASGSGVHIQFEFDILTGKITDLYFTDAMHQDVMDARESLPDIEKGSLILRDLGYYSTDVLEEIARKEAYFISRIKPKIKIYKKERNGFKQIELKDIHRHLKKYKLSQHHMKVYIGEHKKMPVNMVVETMPEQETEKRIRKASREATKKGRKLSEGYRTQASLNIFITNIPQKLLKADKVRSLYRLRWQIELRFKIWKSICQINKVKKMSKERFECYLYANLLYIIINWEIAINYFSLIWKVKQKAMSMMKFYKTMFSRIYKLRMIFIEQRENADDFLSSLFKVSLKNHILEKLRGTKGLEEILVMIVEQDKRVC